MPRGFSALFWRELKHGRSILLLLSYVIPPTLYMLVFGLTLTRTIAIGIEYQGKYIPYLVFFTPGLLAMTSIEFERSFSITRLDNTSKLFLVLLSSDVRAWEYVFAKIASYLIPLIAQAIYLTALTALITGYVPSIDMFVFILLGLTLSLIFWSSLGIVFGLHIQSEIVRDIVFIIIGTPVRLLSNVFYPLEKMPEPIRTIALFNPLTHTCIVVRSAYINATIPLHSFTLLAILSLSMLTIALVDVSIYRVR